MNQDGAKRLVNEFDNINHHIIKNAGHQLIFDNPKDVTNKLIEIFKWLIDLHEYYSYEK